MASPSEQNDNVTDNNESSQPESELNKRRTVLQKTQILYKSKKAQRLFLILSLASGLFDLFTDWSVTANFYIQKEYGWGITLTIFLLFHNIISLLYHRSEHNEQKEHQKAQKLTTLKDKTSSIQDIELQQSPKSNDNSSRSIKAKEFRSDDWSKIVAEIEYDGSNTAKCWEYPFFMIGMGAYAASYQCLLRGEQNQVYMENRYFEVLLESMPIGLVTIFAQLSLNDYNWIVILSILTSAISVGSGTAVYFARSHKNGNPLEFRPIITSNYLWILLGFTTTSDYILRIYCPLLLVNTLLKWDNYHNLWIIQNIWILIIIIPALLLIIEVILIYLIHGDRNFSIGFGWLALYSSSVPYFAGVATRFHHYTAFWIEIVFRNLVNVCCVVIAVIYNKETRDRNTGHNALTDIELEFYVYILLGLFVVSNVVFVILVINTKSEVDQLQVGKSDSTFGRRAFDVD